MAYIKLWKMRTGKPATGVYNEKRRKRGEAGGAERRQYTAGHKKRLLLKSTQKQPKGKK